ncbi:E3 ubiquitin-protein ligase HUWE1 [Halotydeus destructor]|nr:E3 ubiquitin-protein ligase HUWE1 [Halotydeus destructor]
MKIDRTKLKKSSSEVPPDCRLLIERLKGCSEGDLLKELKNIRTWNFGKCELYHWIDVLDLFDAILERGVHKEGEGQWALPCDYPSNEMLKDLIIHIVIFTALLIEHSFSRHLYNSMEHLTTLLSSSDMQIVLAVLNLLYVFSKRSNFISRLNSDRRQALILRLNYLAESWGGKENGFGLAECCQDLPLTSFPTSATTLHFEFYSDDSNRSTSSAPVTPRSKQSTNLTTIHIDNVDQLRGKTLAEMMQELVATYNVPKTKQILLFTHLRLASSFSTYRKRLQCVQARLQALSIIVYCNSMSVQDSSNNILYNGFIEELVDVLELKNAKLLDIKAAALRTLTSVIHLDHSSKLSSIIDVTGAASYHGFLPTLVRSCIQALIDGNQEAFPLPFATALFSFLYHLASYENGGESLVSCGMIESLLKVISWKGSDAEHITFVTRAVRVIDLITNLDMSSFQTHNGLNIFINRLESEIDVCRKEQPFEIDVPVKDKSEMAIEASPSPGSMGSASNDGISTPMDVDPESSPKPSGSTIYYSANGDVQCYAQRAALLKSMLNFLKKAIQDSAFSDSIRHVMDGNLPRSLRHIISNAEYYGPSLFMLATDVVTVYVFQEPSLLSSLQESGLTHVVLHALLIKDVPATREVLASLPNVFSALCLNSRGLESFVACKPFQRIFKVLLSPDYLPAMRRRRSSDPMGDTASNLGNAMDELMRHQPSLRTDATLAIINLLEELCSMGTNPNYICAKPSSKGSESSNQSTGNSRSNITATVNDGGSSDEDDDEDEENTNGAPSGATAKAVTETMSASGQSDAKQHVPLVDYILNVMRFIDAILSNNSTDDHCREFVKQKGLQPLLKVLQLPNLPVDFPLSPACLSVASVCKSILTLAHEREVLNEGLRHLTDVLTRLEPLHESLPSPGGSVLLEELVNATSKNNYSICGDPLQSATLTPLLHTMSAAHAYIILFVHVCRTGQSDMRNLSVTHWGSELGLEVLKRLSKLYTSLVWESTVLLALCSESTSTANWQFGRHQLERLAILAKEQDAESGGSSQEEQLAMEVDEPSEGQAVAETSGKKKEAKPQKLQAQVKQIKPLLSSASRLGRALAELFGLLVKLCVGSPIRQRRGHHAMPNIPLSPSPAARAVAGSLTKLLANGLSWEPPPTSPIPKFRLTFYICSVGFTSPMLFDERKFPFHLMLQKFVNCGGQEAFFKTFEWALSQGGKVPLDDGLEHPDLPDGTGEFLDSWLLLLEKMVNPKTILESPHILPNKGPGPNQAFDAVTYLIKTQKRAFQCVLHLWNKKPLKTYGERMSESVLTILCHLLKGETIVQEKLKSKETEVVTPAPVAPVTNRASRRNELEEQGINSDHLQQLQDMGFSRELALEALLQSSTLEQATEFLLSNPQPVRVNPPGGADWDMTEEDQITRAIAMSLGDGSAAEEEKADEKEAEPLTSELIEAFSKKILPGCLQLLDTLPETVYRVCDLLIAVSQRNGQEWTESMLCELIQEIQNHVDLLMKATEPLTSNDNKSISEWASQISDMPEASKAASRIHVFSLLFEEKRIECALFVHQADLVHNLVQLLEATQNTLSVLSNNAPISIPTPKWLAPVILLIDLFEKSITASSRRSQLLGLLRQWKWFDDRSGKWSAYTAANNKTIDDAYARGESYIRFSAGRRKYTVQFSTMVQINEETGNWRPIMFIGDDKAMEVTEEGVSDKSTLASKVVENLQPLYAASLIRACVGFINIPVEPDTLHAVMRLCLRLTRSYENAAMFAEVGGVKAILQLTQASAFTGFNSLASLIIRHILEEPVTLRQTIEKVIRSTTLHSPLHCKEMHYILRVLGPAACRDSDLFSDVARNVLRVSLGNVSKREDEDSRLLAPNAVQMLKLLPAKAGAMPPLTTVTKSVVCDLLQSLVAQPANGGKNEETKDKKNLPKLSSSLDETLLVTRNLLERGLEIAEQDSQTEVKGPETKDVPSKDDDSKKFRLLMSQSSILRLLAELARSYSVVAKLITDFTYHPNQSQLVSEDCSALSFILDQLLPSSQTIGDKDCPALTRVLVASLSSCNHCPDAQTALVTEVKSALTRALTLSESNEKHAKVQALTGLMCVMIESCPAVNQAGQQQSQNAARNQPTSLNNIVKIMLRKNLVNDLARVTHSLDLSSPQMSLTVNSALKPLETLSRMVNMPTLPVASNSKKSNAKTSNLMSVALETMESENTTVTSTNANDQLHSGGQNLVRNITGSGAVSGLDIGTGASDTNAFADVTADDGTDNEGIVIDPVTFDEYNEQNPVSASLLEEEIRNDNMVMDDSQHIDESHDTETHDNVMNSNGAESESGDDSSTDDDEDDDNSAAEEDDREDEDEEDDDHVDDDDDGEDDEGASGYVEHDDIDELMRFSGDRDADPFVFDIEEMIPTSMFQESGFRLSSLLPMLEGEPTTTQDAQPSVPPAPGSVAISHPLLVRHGDLGTGANLPSTSSAASILQVSRGHRGVRSQRMYRPVSGATVGQHGWHLPLTHRTPAPAVGSSSATPTQVIFTSNDFHIIAEDDLFELQDTGLGNGASSTLSSIPSAMLRWTEESRVLDGDSMHDCVASIKPAIIELIEKKRDEEIEERKEQRRKIIEEDERKKKENRELQKSAAKNNEAAVEKVPNEVSVNATTERLAESVAEQVLGSIMGSSDIASTSDAEEHSTGALPLDASASLVEVAQNDNEITEMICSEATAEQDRPIEMETNVDTRYAGNPVPQPNDLSALVDTVDSPLIEDEALVVQAGDTENIVPIEEVSSAPEASNIVEVVNSDGAGAAESSSQDQAAPGVPEGIDPSFLAALPENIRQEVIAEQLRLQRMQQQRSAPLAPTTSGTVTAPTFSEVNPEFLAALPPNIQEEVLAQQRIEQQQRQAATTTANPETPVDPANFIQTLPPSLRRQVLADMDDSLLALLPEGLASEAQTLRQELEARHRQIQERFFSSHAGTALSRILRTAGRGTRYTIHTVQGSNWPWNIGPRSGNTSNPNSSATHRFPLPSNRVKGRQLLDHEALSCLLILLFVDEPKLNINRLHRVLRNLSHHAPTRQWIVQSLLTIMQRTQESKENENVKSKKTGVAKLASGNASWLSISLDAALGCRTNVFQVQRSSAAKKGISSPVSIHSQAAPLVTRHVLDALISLAKAFPHHFIEKHDAIDVKTQVPKDENYVNAKFNKDADFWDVLVKLDSLSSSKKGKLTSKAHGSSSSLNSGILDTESDGNESMSSQLAPVVKLLSHPVIKRSSLLTDRLLRLLSNIALALPIQDSTSRVGAQLKTGETLKDSALFESKSQLAIDEEQLQLAVDVLTSKSCSEEGLDDVTSFLLRLSKSCPRTRHIVIKLLLNGCRQLGTTVCENIATLNAELKSLNLKVETEEPDSQVSDKISKGMLHDRFTQQSVVITAPTNVKASVSKEVQLPSMAALTSKTSSQSFFLRVLKVIIQLKDSAKKTTNVNSSTRNTGESSSTEAQQSMETDEKKTDESTPETLSSELNLSHLWDSLSGCLLELADAPDHHAVLVLQPAVEAFFLVHASEKEPLRSRDSRAESRESQLAHVNFDIAPASPGGQSEHGGDEKSTNPLLSADTRKFLQFAETHKIVLNQILRQSTTPLTDGPFSVLVDHTRVLDFDVKRRYFRQELERLDDGNRREDLAVHVRREHVFEDSFRELYRRACEEWKNRFYIVFEGEEGQDAGGLLREWYTIISREIFNPMYALFTTSPGDRVTYMINSASHCNSNHLQYFKFVGRVIAKAIYDNKLLECYFTRSFYKHILGKSVKYTDMESEDYSFYQGLVFLLENSVKDLGYELTFSVEVQEFGVPLQGFATLEGMNGTQKFQIHRDDRSTDRLPSAHTCFNQLDLPAYETYDKLRSMLLKAIRECSEGFGFA